MKKSGRNFLIGVGAAVAGVASIAVATYQITNSLMNMAMDRNVKKDLSKGKKIISGGAEYPELAEKIAEASKIFESKNLEKVEIVAEDGCKLVGHWYPCENPKRIIIAMHGWRSSWSHDFCAIADFWHNNGCSVLYPEQRGQGSSGGDYIGFGLLERYDCLQWANWISEYTNTDLPVYLAGVSMGATTVLMTAGFELPSNVHGIMADCGFTSPHAIWKHVVEKNLRMSYGIYSAAANDLCRKRINVGANDYSTIEAMQNCKTPVLFIHGTDDKFVPIEMTYENYKACNAEKRLLIVPGAEHGMSYTVDKEKYEKTTLEFWNDFD